MIDFDPDEYSMFKVGLALLLVESGEVMRYASGYQHLRLRRRKPAGRLTRSLRLVGKLHWQRHELGTTVGSTSYIAVLEAKVQRAACCIGNRLSVTGMDA